MITFPIARSFIERPKGSNSIEQLLSMVKQWIEIRFLIICGETRILCRCNERSVNKKEVEPIAVIGKEEPLSTIILGGVKEVG
jgi:hypothetical protein